MGKVQDTKRFPLRPNRISGDVQGKVSANSTNFSVLESTKSEG